MDGITTPISTGVIPTFEDQPDYFFTASEKGHPKLNHDGHVYNWDKYAQAGGIECGSLWKCEKKTGKRCLGRARTENNVVTITRAHNHEGSVSNEEISRYRSYIKQRFEETLEPAHIILSNASALIGKDAMVNLPPIHHTKRRGQRIRARVNGALPEPKDRASVPYIPDKYKVTKKNKDFLRYDSGPESGNDRILIFASDEGTDMLVKCVNLFGDGTFNAAPEVFYQLYVVGAYVRGYVYPCAYALLPNKTAETYTQLFNQISAMTEDKMNPESFMMDFEPAQKKAVEDVFPAIKVSGCLFHLSQNILKHVREEKLIKTFRKDPSFVLNCKMIAALSMVPVNEVGKAFDELSSWDDLHKDIDPIMTYFEENYIGLIKTKSRVRKKSRRSLERVKPRFQHVLWNVYHRILEGLPRSNNSMEGFNRGFNSQIMCSKPNIWKLLEALQREESLHYQKLVNVCSGGLAGQKKRVKYLNLDLKLENLAKEFRSYNGDYVSYLRDAALAISME